MMFPHVPNIEVNGKQIERVSECKLLGVYLNDKLNWDSQVDHMYKKACQRVHFIGCLKRSKLSQKDIIKVYTSLVRPVLEYACQVWHPGLTGYHSDLLESVQERVLKMIFPGISYTEALTQANLQTLSDRRKKLCERLFIASQDNQH